MIHVSQKELKRGFCNHVQHVHALRGKTPTPSTVLVLIYAAEVGLKSLILKPEHSTKDWVMDNGKMKYGHDFIKILHDYPPAPTEIVASLNRFTRISVADVKNPVLRDREATPDTWHEMLRYGASPESKDALSDLYDALWSLCEYINKQMGDCARLRELR